MAMVRAGAATIEITGGLNAGSWGATKAWVVRWHARIEGCSDLRASWSGQ